MKKKLLLRIASFLQEMRTNLGLTIRDFASALDVSPGSITAYLAGRELPSLDVVVKIARLGGVSMDELINSDKEPKKNIVVTAQKNSVIGAVAGGNIGTVHIHNNTTERHTHQYTYQPGDMTEVQAAELTRIINEIVELEAKLKQRPKKHGSVWAAFKRHFKLVNYRKFPAERFSEAKAYLERWRGRLKGMKSFAAKAPDDFRKAMYRDINTIAKVELRWTKQDLDAWVFDKHAKVSLRELDDAELRLVKQRLVTMKINKRKSKVE